MVVIHPCRVEVINKQFKPIKPEIALAKRIVEAFNDRSGEGILMLDGRRWMLVFEIRNALCFRI